MCLVKDINDLKEVPNEGAGAVLVWVHYGCPFDDEGILKLPSSKVHFIKNLPVIIIETLESCFLKTCACFPDSICRLTLAGCQFRQSGERPVQFGDE